MADCSDVVGRFAPTPSGKLHIGNAFSFLIAYLVVKQQGGFMRMRVEDIDTVRCKASFIDTLFRDFEWLGFDWEGPVVFQSKRTEAYKDAFHELLAKNLVYPCFCSRADLHAASAPHQGEEIIYPGTCRNLSPDEQRKRFEVKDASYRIKVSSSLFSFEDLFQGYGEFNLATMSGDFVVRRSDGVFAYQLAVAVDDAYMGVNSVVRGVDLLTSAPRQRYIQDCLGLPTVTYGHVPLILDEQGRRLAKRSGDISLEYFRTKRGLTSKNFWGKLAYSCGIVSDNQPYSLDELVECADLSSLIGVSSIQLHPYDEGAYNEC